MNRFFKILVLLSGVYAFFFFGTLRTINFKFHDDIYAISKKIPTYYQKEYKMIYGDTVYFNNVKSKPYSFVYKIDIGDYDSVYFFGYFPEPYMLKNKFPENIIKKYRRYYLLNLQSLISSGLLIEDERRYKVCILYKNNNVMFKQFKFMENEIMNNTQETMIHNKTTTKVNGRNYNTGNKLISEIWLQNI